MYFPILYITCLTLLSNLSWRETGRTYGINIQTTSFFKQRVEKKLKIYAMELRKTIVIWT